MKVNDKTLHQMLTIQDELNTRINPAWHSMNYNFHRAILVESVEALGYTDWPWWKKQEANTKQLQLEVVDIWHFMLCQYLDTYGTVYDTLDCIKYLAQQTGEDKVLVDHIVVSIEDLDLASTLQTIAALAASGRTSIHLFNRLLALVDMTWEDLYRQYIGKNALNTFRQQHGLKEGTYTKLWDGVNEDNVFLSNILDKFAGSGYSDNLAYDIYREL